ncbi:MAG: DMT family transporter [Acetobacteraceae bacterium]
MTDRNLPIPVMGAREWALLLILAALWGGSFFFYKLLVAALPPFAVVLGRVGLAALILNAWLLLRGRSLRVPLQVWAAFLVMGLLNNVVPFSLIAFGEIRISSGLASILNATTPIFTVLVAHALTADEKLRRGKLAGVALGFAGVSVLVGPTAIAGIGSQDVMGEAASLLAALAYAFAGIYGRRFRLLPPMTVATGQLTASTFVLIPLVLLFDPLWKLPMPNAEVWMAMIGIAVFCTVLAYILYFRILAAAGATNVLLVTFLVPVSALVLGSAVLGETLHARELLGMALIGGGLACIDGRLLTLVLPRAKPPPRAFGNPASLPEAIREEPLVSRSAGRQ